MKNKESGAIRVIISGGGTGGHIFPAISIANEVRRRHPDAEILFVGAENRMEMERVPAAGYKIEGLPVMGLDRRRPWRNVKVLARLWSSMRRARKIVREFRPDIAVGVGGYAAGPVLKAAQKAGVPTLLQEQNSYAGVTNKLLAKKAQAICVAYDGMERFFPADKIIKTGNPIRDFGASDDKTKAEAKAELGFDATMPLVLVLGGSLGSRSINSGVGKALPDLDSMPVSVLWQTGKFYADECAKTAYPYRHVRARAFIDDMATAYKAADLVVSRAGASTISELQTLGLPSILVPSPNVAEDHQTKNARALADRDAAWLVSDADMAAGDAFRQLVREILADTTGQLATKSRNIRSMALPDAAARIVDRIEKTIQENKD